MTPSGDSMMQVAEILAKAHRRLPLVFWTADDGFQTTWGLRGERLDPDHVELRLRRLPGFGTLT